MVTEASLYTYVEPEDLVLASYVSTIGMACVRHIMEQDTCGC